MTETQDKFDASIDKDRLDEEWLGQPNAAYRAGKRYALACLQVDEAEDALKVLDAELFLAIQEDPGGYNLNKSNVDTIKAAVLVQESRRAAAETVRDAKHRRAIYKAACDAMEHRKRGLENLVVLHGREYFAEPVARGEKVREAVERAGQRAVVKRTKVRDPRDEE